MFSSLALAAGNDEVIDSQKIKVTFLSQDPDPVEPGENVDVRFRVENFGSFPVDDVVFNLALDYPFTLADPSKKFIDLGTLGTRQKGDESAILFWRLKVDENAVEVDEDFTLIYNTKNYGVIFDDEDNFFIRIQGRESLLAVESIETIPAKPMPGHTITQGRQRAGVCSDQQAATGPVEGLRQH